MVYFSSYDVRKLKKSCFEKSAFKVSRTENSKYILERGIAKASCNWYLVGTYDRFSTVSVA